MSDAASRERCRSPNRQGWSPANRPRGTRRSAECDRTVKTSLRGAPGFEPGRTGRALPARGSRGVRGSLQRQRTARPRSTCRTPRRGNGVGRRTGRAGALPTGRAERGAASNATARRKRVCAERQASSLAGPGGLCPPAGSAGCVVRCNVSGPHVRDRGAGHLREGTVSVAEPAGLEPCQPAARNAALRRRGASWVRVGS